MHKNKQQTQNNKRGKSNRGVRKRAKENCQINLRKACSKYPNRRCKAVQNTNTKDKITSGRVTVPLEFFKQGVKSKTVRKNTKDCAVNLQNYQHFLNEDLHALLRTVSEKGTPEPSSCHEESKISKHTSAQIRDVQTHYDSVADYYEKLESQQESKNQELQETNENDGRSIFKEINRLYREATIEQQIPVSNKNLEVVTKTIPSLDYNFTFPQMKIHTSNKPALFCKNLEKQLRLVTFSSRKAACINIIKTKVAEINAALDGQEISSDSKMRSKRVIQSEMEEKLPAEVPQFIPKSNWVYKTPNSQKLRRPVVNSCSTELQPCILQKDVESKVAFDFDKSALNLNFLNGILDTSHNALLSASAYDDNSVFNRMNVNENFRLPLGLTSAVGQTSRNIMPLFSSNNIPLFEDPQEPLQKTLTHKNVLVTHRPTKTPKNSICDKIGTPRRLYFGEMTKRQKMLSCNYYQEEENEDPTFEEFVGGFNSVLKNRLTHSDKKVIPATVTSEAYFQQLPYKLDWCSSSKENSQPRDFSNHPKSFESILDETFIIDKNCTLPLPPDLNDPSPLPFYPRKLF